MRKAFCVIALVAFMLPVSAQAELYLAAGRGSDTNLYIIDEATGANIKTVGDTGFLLTGIAFHPLTGELYGTTSNNDSSPGTLVKIDPDTGFATAVGTHNGPIVDISFAPDGTLYGWSEDADYLATIDLTTGAETQVGSNYSTLGHGMDFAPDGRLWRFGRGVISSVDCLVAAWDKTTSTNISTTATIASCDYIGAGTHHPNGTLYVSYHTVADHGFKTQTPKRLGILNKSTGTISQLGFTIDDASALAWRPEDLKVHSITPCRVFDTRQTGNPFTQNEIQSFLIWGICGIPQSAVAVEINLTAVGPTEFGYLRAWPTGESEPTATLMTWPAGVSISNSTAVPINNDYGSDLTIKIYLPFGGQTHIVGDAIGYRAR